MNVDLNNLLTSFSNGLLQPLFYPLDPSRRIFWLFLLSSLLLALFAAQKQTAYKNILSAFFSRSYWFNHSTFQDIGWLLGNSILKAAFLAPLFVSHLAATVWVGGQFQSHWGDAPQLEWSPWIIAGSYTLVFFVAEDLSRFSLHLAMHKVPLLWHFHRVHHSATTLTPLTIHRVHTVEMALYFLRGWCVFAVVSGFFIYLFKGRVSAWDILGVDALGFLFNLFGANLRHSHVWLSFGLFEKFFISPAQHQLHHSKAVEHRDINFGTCLAIWDKCLGSWRSGKKKPKTLRFGL